MRPLRLALFTLPLLVTTAAARPSGGGGGGGGALGKVSSGIGGASGAHSPSSSSSSGNARRADVDERIAEVCYDGTGRVIDEHDTDECYYPRVNHFGNTVLVRRRARVIVPPSPPAKIAFYAGAQKVHDSDGSASLALAVTEWRLRVSASYARYFERQPVGGTLTMSMPTLTGGLRIDDFGATAVYLEGGVVHVRTNNDVMGDSKLTGPIAGMRVEHALSKDVSLLGDVQQMWFDHEIRATAGHVGVRYKYVEAGFRVLDFNVGPPLYGPEVGVRF